MKYTIALFLILGLTQTSQAQQSSLWGTGYWAGQQGCSAQMQNVQGQQSLFGQNQNTELGFGEKAMGSQSTSKVKTQKNKVSQYESEKKLLEAKQERLTKKIEKFFDSEISDFLLQTHFEKMNKCDDYRTYPKNQCASPENKSVCDGKDEVPEKLQAKWTTENGGYCNASSNSSRGNVQSAICNDSALRPSDASKYRTYSSSGCSQSLSEYRKNKLKLDQLQEKIERTEEEISDLELASEEEKLNPSRESLQSKTEAGCEECTLAGRTGSVQKPNRDWWSTAANVAGGLGMIWYGKKIDESAQAYNAQLGYPSTNSYGSPFVSSGVSTLINGLTGTNGNCTNNTASQYGIGSYGGLNGGYANSNSNSNSAFGYPQNYNGAYAGGGMYNSSYNYNGLLNSGLNNYNNTYGTSYYNGLNNYTSSNNSNASQMQLQLQAYNQISVSQQTPDIQVTIAQLQARINAMSNGNYNYTSNYGTSYGSTYSYPYSTTGYGTSVLSGR